MFHTGVSLPVLDIRKLTEISLVPNHNKSITLHEVGTKEYFISKLNLYKTGREANQNTYTGFFKNLSGFTRADKIKVADKLLRMINGEEKSPLTPKEIEIASSSNLGKIYNQMEKFNFFNELRITPPLTSHQP